MRHLICSCTIGQIKDTERDWIEELDVYLDDNEGDPKKVGATEINKAAERDLNEIINQFNEIEIKRYGTAARTREIKHFIVIQNRNYE